MRGTAVLSPVKYKFKQIYPLAGSWGNLATSTPKKQGSNDSVEEGLVTKEKNDPIVAFGRPPPPLPPVLGPLVVLSLLQTWSSRDGNDD